MNEKFGFLSSFGGIKIKPVKKKSPIYVTPTRGELTDNPPAKNPLLTDDESEEEEAGEQHQQPILNRILESSSSSSIFVKNDAAEDPDRTYCSLLELSNHTSSKITSPKARKSTSEPLFDSDDLNSRDSHKIKPSSADIDDELCSRMSEVYVEQKPIQPTQNSLKDTIADPFSDEPEEDQEIRPGKLTDTVLYSSNDESDFEEPIMPLPRPIPKKKPPMPKPSLADTIIGFSESMSELSIAQAAPEKVVEELQETDSEDEVITVLDSEEEDSNDISAINDLDQPPILPTNDSFENCSSIFSSGPKASAESDTTVNRFFNHPPSANPDRVVSHSIIQRFREQPAVAILSPVKEKSADVSADRFKVATYEDKNGSFVDPDVELVETDTSDSHPQVQPEFEQEIRVISPIPEIELEDHDTPPEIEQENHDVESHDEPEVVESEEIVPSQRTRQPSSSSEDQTQSTYENISISTKIKMNFNVNLKITVKEMSDSSSSEENSSPPPSPKQTPRKTAAKETPKSNKKNDSARKEKQTAKPGSATKTTPKVMEIEKDDFHTPTKAQPCEVIDEDLQKILDSLYGESWKTPQLLKSCKSKTVQKDLRKSIHANNFENFVKNLPKDLESTRIASSSDETEKNKKVESVGKKKEIEFVTPKDPKKFQSSTKKQPTSSVKKTPTSSNKKTPAKTTPKYLEICDSDTPSDDSSSDEDFKPNETWNASSDEDYKDEDERIKKRSIARKSRRDEEIIFVPDDSAEDKQKKLDDLLERYEYKKPPVMQGTDAPTKKPSKRKLFTHSHYEDELNLDSTPNDEDERKKKNKEKENDDNTINLPGIFFPRPFPVTKKDTAKKLEMPPLPIIVKRTPKSKVQTPKSTVKPLENKFAAYSFLKSLDVGVNPTLCNADALYYRNNYKSKRIELTDKLFKLYDEKVFDGQLSVVPVKWNKKLLNTAGRCNNSRRGGVRQSQLELSEKVLTSADRLRCTLIHEMCHAATWIIQGENGHGATWKRWAAKANSIFQELPKINVCHDYVIEYRYTYQCTHCKAKYQAHSKSKKVENIRCSICRSAIELFLNKKNKDGEIVMTPVSRDVKGFPKFVKINYKDIKKPNMTHKEVMQVLSQQFGCLSVEEKQNL